MIRLQKMKGCKIWSLLSENVFFFSHRIASGVLIILIGAAARWPTKRAEGNKYWSSICSCDMKKLNLPFLFLLQVHNVLVFHLFLLEVLVYLLLKTSRKTQVILVGVSSAMVWLSTSHRMRKQELHPIHQFLNWCTAGRLKQLCPPWFHCCFIDWVKAELSLVLMFLGLSMILPLFSENDVLSRLTSVFLGFAPSFLLLSIGYISF